MGSMGDIYRCMHRLRRQSEHIQSGEEARVACGDDDKNYEMLVAMTTKNGSQRWLLRRHTVTLSCNTSHT